jgi:DNA polymerase-3 subunit epsilon
MVGYDRLMHAVAIDFETANEQRSSPCSIGLAWINDGKIESVEHHYIRPPGMRFASFNIAFHGIGPEQVEDAEEFPAVLAAIAPRLEGRTVLAHNAAFDVSVIRGTCDHYGLTYPEFDYLCTVKLAQITWPDFASHKLNNVCAELGIQFKHHDAAEDAFACASVALETLRKHEANCANTLASAAGISLGRLYAGGYNPCSSAGSRPRRPRA